MKRFVLSTILKMLGKAGFITILVATIIAVIGYLRKWDTALAYSNAFFIGGGLIIIAGALSRLGAGQDWGISQLLYAESFREMDSGQRAEFIINASSSISRLILGLVSGLMLILISALLAAMS